MSTNKKIISLIIILIMLLTLATAVNAYTVTMNLTSEEKYIKEGTEVIVKINLGEIETIDGIKSITANLSYDKNVFEEVKKEDISGQNEWNISYSTRSGNINFIKTERTTTSELVATVKLKFKETVAGNSTTVTLGNIIASGGRVEDGETGDITVSDASVTFTREVKPSPSPEPSVSPEAQPSTPAKNIEVKEKDSTTAKVRIPQTGVSYDIVIALVAVVILSVVSYVAYEKTKKDIK